MMEYLRDVISKTKSGEKYGSYFVLHGLCSFIFSSFLCTC